MEYLAIIPLTQGLATELEREPGTTFSHQGPHCKLWDFDVLEGEEERLTESFSRISQEPFTTHIIGLIKSTYDTHGLLIEKTPELQELHNALYRQTKEMDINFNRAAGRFNLYGGEKYQPQIVISHSQPNLQTDYHGREIPVGSYRVLKKKGGVWQAFRDFSLQQT
jgi:hypothetical protein